MRLKVLHVLEAVEGGTARYVADLVTHAYGVDHLVAMPHARSVGVTDSASIARIEEASAEVRFVDLRRSPVALANVSALREVRRLVVGERPAVVHGHSTIGGAIARLAGARSPVVYTPNALFPGPAATLAERAFGRRTAAIVAVSESEAGEVRRRRLVRPERIHLIRTGIAPGPPADAPAPFDLRERIGAPAAAPVVGTAIRLVAQKDPGTFADAMEIVLARHPTAHAVVMGDGPLRGDLEGKVAASGVADRVHLLGHVPEARSLLPQVDVFVLPSRYEGLPYALLEAMQAGAAAVATDAVGNRDVIVDDTTGLLVPVGAPAELAAAVDRLLADAGLRSRLAAAGRHAVATDFTVTAMADAYRQLYERLAASSAG